jgi:hypothetical protein
MRRHKTVMPIILLLCVLSINPGFAFEHFAGQQPVSEAVLDSMRGGFQSDTNGPIMSFGIEKSVFVNGRLVASTVLTIPNLLQLAGNSANAFTLIQNGGGNVMTNPPSSLPALMTVIQNSLDNQAIQNQTVINATVSALSLARSLALGNAVSQANLTAIHH